MCSHPASCCSSSARLVRTDNEHWWLAVGLALENKYTVVLRVISLAVGAALTGCWRRLLSWWVLAGAFVAVLIWLPQLLWQIDHGWPQLSFARALARDQGGENRSTLLPFQLVILGPPLAPLVVAGLWALLRRPQWAPIWFLPVGYGVLLILLALTGGKGYYAAGMFGVIIAAASIATRDWIAGVAACPDSCCSASRSAPTPRSARSSPCRCCPAPRRRTECNGPRHVSGRGPLHVIEPRTCSVSSKGGVICA